MAYLCRMLAMAVLALAAPVVPASAQNWESWVSTTGGGTECTRQAPCLTYGVALAHTVPRGTIRCLDQNMFAFMNISQSVTIDCKGAQGSNTYILIDGDDIDVVLRGITVKAQAGSNTGIMIQAARSVTVEDVMIRSYESGAPLGNGIHVRNSSGVVNLTVKGTTILNNSRLGIAIEPTGSGAANVTVANSTIGNNSGGIRADTGATNGWINLAVTDTVISSNSSLGIIVNAGAGLIKAGIDGSTLVHNTIGGLKVSGANATVVLGRSVIATNGIGTQVTNGGRLFSYGDNRINNNGDNGPNPMVIIQK